MASETDHTGRARDAGASHRGRNALVFALVVCVWIAIDQATKAYFDSGAFSLGDHIAGPFLGSFRFTLVHNTGGAWGVFGGSPVPLAILSIIVCVVLVVYLFGFAPRASIGQAIGVSLIVAGGVGNAIDRLSLGYVVDFVEFTFVDFPVFNIADIGVTCGFVILIVSTLVAWREEG